MALDRFGAEAFAILKEQNLPITRVLTLGRQHFTVHPRDFQKVPGLDQIARDAPQLNHSGERFAEDFFRQLGVAELVSIDASAYESCDLVHDLNRPIPREWHQKYDVVFDGGTLEHVFHVPNAFQNALDLVRAGGCFVSCTPSNNYNGHGFYQFSPEFFFRLLDENRGFRVLAMALAESSPKGQLFSVSDPAQLGHRVNFQGKGMTQLVIIAQRTETEPEHRGRPLYQSDYSNTWDESGESGDDSDASSDSEMPLSWKQRLRGLLPTGLLFRYDSFTHARKHQRLAMRGVERVERLSQCLVRPPIALEAPSISQIR